MRPPYLTRMEGERQELAYKIEALAGWITNEPHFNALVPDEQREMRDQLFHMRGYAAALDRRIERALARHQ